MIKFNIFGHKNTLSTHKNTVEFTKDIDLTKNGDCILGVNSDFVIDKGILKFKKIKIIIICDNIKDTIICDVNPDFNNKHEIVIRKSGFLSDRTLGIYSDKAAIDIDRRIVDKLKDPEKKAEVIIEGVK